MDYIGRIKRLQEGLEAPLKAPDQSRGVDALYVSNLPNVRYLCGFTGSNGALLVGPHAAWFLTDGRYRTQAAGEVVGAEVEVYGLPDQLGAALRRIAAELGVARVGFEADHVAVAAAERLKEHFPGAELVPTSGLVEALPDDTVICRCETIRAGELRGSARLKGAWEVNRAKAFSRVGMGRCQGRYCGHAAAEVLAASAGVPIEEVGRLRSQAPVKPLSIATSDGAIR